MTQTQINILQVDDKTSAKGQKYALVHTNLGQASCWDGSMIGHLKEKIGQTVNADIVVSADGKYNQIKSIVGFTPAAVQPFAQAKPFSQPQPFSKGNGGVKQASSFELSYSKDMWICLAASCDESDPVKRDEMLRYYAELCPELVLQMRDVINGKEKVEEA